MTDRGKVNKAQVRSDWGRDRDKVSTAIDFPECAHVFSSFKLPFNDMTFLVV